MHASPTNRRKFGRFTVKRQIDERGYCGPKRWGVYSKDGLIEGGFTTRYAAVRTAEGLELNMRAIAREMTKLDLDSFYFEYATNPGATMTFGDGAVGARAFVRKLRDLGLEHPNLTIHHIYYKPYVKGQTVEQQESLTWSSAPVRKRGGQV